MNDVINITEDAMNRSILSLDSTQRLLMAVCFRMGAVKGNAVSKKEATKHVVALIERYQNPEDALFALAAGRVNLQRINEQ